MFRKKQESLSTDTIFRHWLMFLSFPKNCPLRRQICRICMYSCTVCTNGPSIHVRHDHDGTINRLRMAMLPDEERDILRTIAAWADGAPTDVISEFKTANATPQNDIVLLHSATILKGSPFVYPRSFHPPSDESTTTKSININILSYNGLPNGVEGLPLYPNTPKEDIIAGLRALYPESLS
jgi:hypothetical protein